MNVKLSVCVSRPKGYAGYAIYKEGRVVDSKVRRILDSVNIKEEILNNLALGFTRLKGNLISHDDLLVIEIQNRHLYEWLSGKVEMKDYSEGLDRAFSVLESLDCRYRFIFVDKPACKALVEAGQKSEIKGVSAMEAFADLE